MHSTISSSMRIILSLILTVFLVPLFGSASAHADEGTTQNGDDTQVITQGATVTPGWTQSDECEWQILDEALTVRPLPGRESGFLGNSFPWNGTDAGIVSAVFCPGVKARTCTNMFYGCTALTSADLSGLDTANVTSMYSMFTACKSLKSLNLTGVNTSNVTSMNNLFGGCISLESLDVSHFDTSRVTDMSNMFWSCTSLNSLDLSNFDTSKVTSMKGMFDSCHALQVFKVGKDYKACEIGGAPVGGSGGKWWSAASGTQVTRDELFNRSNIADTYTAPQGSPATIKRIAGEEAPDTAAAISAETFPNGSDWVVLARSDDFADAMSATGLAGTLDAPILLTDRYGLSVAASDEVKRLGATKCYVIGGTGAMPGNFEGQLKALGMAQVERVWGNEAWDTSVACADKINAHSGNAGKHAIVAMSSNFQDALSISSFAYKYGVPIFLETSDAFGRTLPDDAVSAMQQLPGTIYVPGGTGAVPSSTVEDVFPGRDVVRLYGDDGYDTSNQVATYMASKGLLSAGTVCVACGAQAAKGSDALAGASLAGKNGGVILLANSNPALDRMSSTTLVEYDSQMTPGFLTEYAPSVDNAYILGGTYVAPENLEGSVRVILKQ